MRLHGCGLQVFLDLLIDFHRTCHKLSVHASDISCEVEGTEVPLQDSLENTVHCIFIEDGEGNHVEVTLESGCDEGLTTTWRAHSRNDHCINDVSEGVLVVTALVPAALVDQLSQNFNWRLCTIVLFLWHVEIVDEDNATHAKFGSEVVLPTLVQLHIDDVLNLVGMGLGRETDLNGDVLLSIKLVQKDVLDVGGFSGTGGADEE